MISDADLVALYDHETVLASAIASVFTNGGFTAGTALTILTDPTFQRQRPRVEIWVEVTGIYQPIQYKPIFDGSLRNMAWKGSLEVSALSNMNSPKALTHSIYRAKVRNFCATLGYRINGGALTKHNIHRIVEGNTRLAANKDEGWELSVLTFSFDFSFQNDALDALKTGDLP